MCEASVLLKTRVCVCMLHRVSVNSPGSSGSCSLPYHDELLAWMQTGVAQGRCTGSTPLARGAGPARDYQQLVRFTGKESCHPATPACTISISGRGIHAARACQPACLPAEWPVPKAT